MSPPVFFGYLSSLQKISLAGTINHQIKVAIVNILEMICFVFLLPIMLL